MPYVLLTARFVLSAVFAVAGAAKLADRPGSRQALLDFGVPDRLVGLLVMLLPLAELAVAAMLLPVALAWQGAVGALFLLFAFLLGIGISVARGRTPNCRCFGQLHSAPAGWSTLARNAVLAGIAGVVVWQGRYNSGPSVFAWWSDLTRAQSVALLVGFTGLALIAGQSALLLQILKQQGRLLLRFDAMEARFAGGPAAPQSLAPPSGGLPLGSRAPGFRLPGLRGGAVTLEALIAAGKPLLLLFTNPHCGPCQALLPDISRWQQELASSLTIVLVSEGTANDNHTKISVQGVQQVLLQKKREVAESYLAWGTPSAVLIRPDGAIGSALAQGAESIRALVAQTRTRIQTPVLAAGREPSGDGQNGNGNGAAPRSSPLRMGDHASALQLRDVHGKTVALSQFRGREVLLLFWNPSCGYCQRMLDDLRNWDADPPIGAPQLIVVSTGSVRDHTAMNLRSPILLDPAHEASASFGAGGTPMAVLLNVNGQIASEIAAGAEAVFALAGAKHKRETAPAEPVMMD